MSYFVDLFANYNDHSLARAVMAVLQHNGIDVNLPEQTGCGMPGIDYGDIDYAKKSIAFNLQHLTPEDPGRPQDRLQRADGRPVPPGGVPLPERLAGGARPGRGDAASCAATCWTCTGRANSRPTSSR